MAISKALLNDWRTRFASGELQLSTADIKFLLEEIERLEGDNDELRNLCRSVREDAGLNDVIDAIGDAPPWWLELLKRC